MGNDTDFMYFTCRSWSRPTHLHDICVDRRDGMVQCSCEDGSYRKKRCFLVDLLDNTPEALSCKHMRELVRVYRGLLG